MRFSNKTIEQLANQTINGENSIELEIDTNLELEEPEPVDHIGVERQLPAFFYSLPRGSLKTATVA